MIALIVQIQFSGQQLKAKWVFQPLSESCDVFREIAGVGSLFKSEPLPYQYMQSENTVMLHRMLN